MSTATSPSNTTMLMRASQVKPIFATPPTHNAVGGDARTFTITLESKVTEPSGDDYDISIVMNPQLVYSYPKSVHVAQGGNSFELTVIAAKTGTSGKVNLEIRERVHKGVITVTLEVQG